MSSPSIVHWNNELQNCLQRMGSRFLRKVCWNPDRRKESYDRFLCRKRQKFQEKELGSDYQLHTSSRSEQILVYMLHTSKYSLSNKATTSQATLRNSVARSCREGQPFRELLPQHKDRIEADSEAIAKHPLLHE